jgi:hypothetical protein
VERGIKGFPDEREKVFLDGLIYRKPKTENQEV